MTDEFVAESMTPVCNETELAFEFDPDFLPRVSSLFLFLSFL